MTEFLKEINWLEVISALWAFILVPILSKLNSYIKTKVVNQYAKILYKEVVNAVKSVYETEVKGIKGTKEWTDKKKAEVKEIAKNKAIQALSSSAYKCLITANKDFETYLDTLISTALYDVKH